MHADRSAASAAFVDIYARNHPDLKALAPADLEARLAEEPHLSVCRSLDAARYPDDASAVFTALADQHMRAAEVNRSASGDNEEWGRLCLRMGGMRTAAAESWNVKV